MQNVTVIFSHGRESGPWGVKIRALAKVAEELGCQVISRDDSDTRDPELRVSRLIDEAKSVQGAVVLVGSSMGGYVAAVASKVIGPIGLFLMAPALNMPGYANHNVQPNSHNLEIVHGWEDDIVPMEGVLGFARTHRARLHVVPAGHALIEQMDWLADHFLLFLERCLQGDSSSAHGRLLSTF